MSFHMTSQRTVMTVMLLVFNAVSHIKKTDGFTGLYRGLVPRLMSTCLNGMVSATVADVSHSLWLCLLL